MIQKQKTIKYPVSCTGIGLHTGVESTITFHPAETNFGIKFMRNDRDDQIITPDLDNVVDLTRGTTIEENEVNDTQEVNKTTIVDTTDESDDIDDILLQHA